MKTASANLLVGRTIVAFELRPFRDRFGRVAHNPVIWLDNGARVSFVAERRG